MTTNTSIAATPEALENGAHASTPPGDNLLLDFARGEAAAYGALVTAAGGRVAVADDLGVSMADAGLPTPFGNLAHLTRPIPESQTEALVETLRSFFAGAGGPFLVWSPWPTGDLGAHGFHLVGHPPFMVRPVHTHDATPLARGLRVVEVTTSDQLRHFEQTLCEAYPAAEMQPFGSQPRLFADGVFGTGWHLYLGYEGARPVATAASYVADGAVIVEAVSTRAECRGRGYGNAITAAASTTVCDRPAALVASDLGRGVYERLGYQPILRYTLWLGVR
jgi:hypothetical protein